MASEDADFSDEFCLFLQTTIPTVEAAELLLALKQEPKRAWPPFEAVSHLGQGVTLRTDEAERYMADFQARGLLAAGTGMDAGRGMAYQPAARALAAHVETLEKVYRERPVTLIRVIYGLRDQKIRSFAEAFRLRRKR